ncbi:MAG: flagellar filament capping protein FliD [Eubacteriales bacterium]|jgi:flagellar hook-associated protein 2
MSTIQITGISSGIDTDSIIKALMQLEKQPVTNMETRVTNLTAKKNAWGTINTKLLSLKNALSDLNLSSSFSGKTTTVNNESVLRAAAGSNSLPETYHFNITSTATGTKTQSTGTIGQPINTNAVLNSSEAGFAITPTSGTFTINNYTFTLNAANDNLVNVVDRINEQSATTGVTASYETDRLVLTSDDPDNLKLGQGADSSNFLTATRLLAAPVQGSGPYTKTSQANLGMTKTDAILDDSRLRNGLLSTTSGSFTINGVSIDYDTTVDSLNDIISRINSSDAQAYASYDPVSDKIGLKSSKTGSIGISLSDTSGNLLATLDILNAQQDLGANAAFSISEINGGATFYSDSNEVSDIIPGLNITLLTSGEASIEVEPDYESTVSKVSDFVNQYNEVISLINDDLDKEGTLSGDISLQSLVQSIWRKTIAPVEGASTSLSRLSQAGITVDRDGKLVLDESKLKSAAQNKSAALADLFGESENGISVRLIDDINRQINDGNGLISVHQKAYEKEIKFLNASIKDMNDRLEIRQQQLESQFTQMEKLISQFNLTSTWLENQISAFKQ